VFRKTQNDGHHAALIATCRAKRNDLRMKDRSRLWLIKAVLQPYLTVEQDCSKGCTVAVWMGLDPQMATQYEAKSFSDALNQVVIYINGDDRVSGVALYVGDEIIAPFFLRSNGTWGIKL